MSTEKDSPEDNEKTPEPPPRLDKDHGDEAPLFKHPQGNVEKLVERGRQMGF